MIPRPTVVPYVVRRTSELSAFEDALTMEWSPSPRTWKDPLPGERDDHGVLWARVPSSPGVGRPVYDEMHVGRQSECMRNIREVMTW
ncbi:hypothetical protein [Streptomyces huiliensis]|uniref:hypothetical protein n=1 Tax=Streptomyces huiliensis TaxID=2876027 RepID=UPI001CBD5D97|nr:hypothetical protein [Streptomyces huiliensis]MBZ4321434.1 hypothetical protein [Streptomyces huiliensis]